MLEPKVPNDQISTPGAEKLDDSELDKLSDDLLDEVSGGASSTFDPNNIPP